jgi:hypothetical protein
MSGGHDVLLTDLLSAAGAFVATALNRMAEPQRQAIGDALARGGELQLRIVPARRPTDQTRVELVLANANGESAEIVRVMCGSAGLNDAHARN